MEECLDSGEACPLIPHGPKHYESKCVQKFTYQRMLVYDPYDKYLPFAVEVGSSHKFICLMIELIQMNYPPLKKRKHLNLFG